MDPAHPLPSRPDRPTEAGFENGQHATQGPTVGTQNDPDPHDDHPTGIRGRLGGSLPVPAEAGKHVGSSRAGLVEALFERGSVVAHGRSIHQHGRWFRQRRHGLHQATGGLQSAVLQAPELGGTPAFFGDRFPGEVHDAISLLQGLQHRRLLPGGGLGGIEAETLQIVTSALGEGPVAAAENGELVPLCEQMGHQLTAHESRTPHQKQPHARCRLSLA